MILPPKYHLLVLWGFAVAQPVYDLMGRYPAFLTAHHLTGLQILALAGVLSFLIPVSLWGMLSLVGKIHRATGLVLHTIVIAVLVALIVYAAVWKLVTIPWVIAGIFATLIWLLALWGYTATRAGRAVVTVLTPAVIVFPAIFILTEPVSKYLFAPDATPKTSTARAHATPPIVMVVFDELPTSVLTGGGPSIDAERFPNFAKLANGSYWFRNATAVDTRTEWALPAILTGQYKIVGQVRAPTVNDYPRNLFTLLSGTYQMRVSEPLTDLCPTDVCSRSLRSASLNTVRRLILDVTTVYMHIVTPPPWRAKLPPINQAWADFGIFRMDQRAADIDDYGRHRQAQEFIRSIEASPAPRLYFMHSNLPHMPYEYFPSGTIYFRHALIRGIHKRNNLDVWSDDSLALAEATQRFVLQVRFVDRIVGNLIARLQQQKLYDEALIIITADHGVSIRAGDLRRGISEVNQRDIAGVPLFIKTPKQKRGVVSDRNVELVDILPAIADVLGLPLDWPTDGRSPFTGPERSHKTMFDGWRQWRLPSDLMIPSDRTRRRWGEETGDGGFAGDLVGQRLNQLQIERPARRSAVVMNARLYEDVRRESFVPAHVVGHVSGNPPGIIAVALNGRIEAVTRTYPGASGERVEFSALLPELAFKEGANRLTLLQVDRLAAGPPRLIQIY